MTRNSDNWMAMYKPFGWEVLDLRYGGLRARLETMHRRLVAYLDPADSSVTRVEELEVELEVRSVSPLLLGRAKERERERAPLTGGRTERPQTIYPNQGCSLMLDYARCSRPQYI